MTDLLNFLLLSLTGVYGAMLFVSYFSFRKLKTEPKFAARNISVAVVVAARNEEANIPGLLAALEAQSCNFSFEVILVDDGSEDNTTAVAQSHWSRKIKLTVLRNGGAGKKDALTTGIHSSLAEVILVTDADCIPDAHWVARMTEQFYDPACCFVGGMIRPHDGDGVLNAALETETIFLQVVSAGMFAQKNPVMCNGASMAFTRDFFLSVGGFTNDQFVSGDDVLLLQKARTFAPTGIRWVKDRDAMVEIRMSATIAEAVEQRHRWISKAKAYSGPLMNLMGPLFLLMQLLLPLAIFYVMLTGGDENPFWNALFLKILIELLLLSLAASFFRATNVIVMLPVSAVVYCIISIGAVFRLFKGDVQWKGRTWKQGRVR